MAFRFVHCSDIHLLDLAGVELPRFFNKRLTGAVNLALGRAKQHDSRLFDRIIEHAKLLSADRLVVTGDVTNLALEPEFELVHGKFAEAGIPVTVIPGNHDVYTRGAARERRFERYLATFMEGERVGHELYPFVQRFGDVALVGLSTGVPTWPLFATGRLGPRQLERLEPVLAALDGKNVTRIVLIHHPVVPGVSKPRHRLEDLEAFAGVIERVGAELVLHGHEHLEIVGEISGPKGQVPVHGISSGTSVSTKSGRRAAFSMYDVEGGTIDRTVFRFNGEVFEPSGAPGY